MRFLKSSDLGAPLDREAAGWREALVDTVRIYAERGYPLLLSGGLDSGSILAAYIALGFGPVCYGYRLDDRLSDDFVFGKRMAEAAGVVFRQVIIRSNLDSVEDDVREVIYRIRVGKKTSVQCCHPMLHIAKRLRANGVSNVVAGTGGIVLDGRAVSVMAAQGDEACVRAFREEKLSDKEHSDTATGKMHELVRQFGVSLHEPYSEEPLRSVGLGIDWAEMNRGPRGFGAKGIAVRAFPRFWMESGFYRAPSPLQVNGGVRELHDRLLGRKAFNPMEAKAVVACYNRILWEIRDPVLFDSAV